jgi:acyl-coenzyme A synthetase/AMP-(fatty) acid ligase
LSSAPKSRKTYPKLTELLANAGQGAKLWTFDEVFAMPDEETEDERIALLPQRVHMQSVASLIFTSGTTGSPKGVMPRTETLPVWCRCSSGLDMTTKDGVVSSPSASYLRISTGFLTPLSRGAQITYLLI